MKRLLAVVLCLVIVLLIGLPALLIRACGGTEKIPPPPDSDDEPLSQPDGELTLTIYQHQSGELLELTLEEYLVGVLAAEMPASFALEAL